MRNDSDLSWLSVSFAHPTESKIWSFRTLRAGWHYGEGVEFSEVDLEAAILLHSEIVGAGLFDTNAFPGLGGEIQVTVYLAGMCAEFTLERNGKWTYVLERGNEEKAYKELLTFDDACSIIKTLPSICATSGPFLVFIGTQRKSDSGAWLSNPHLRTEEFLCLKENARSARAEAFADIVEPSISESPETLQYFGSSPQTYFQTMLRWFQVQFPMETRATITSRG